jgi:hypothetical protein
MPEMAPNLKIDVKGEILTVMVDLSKTLGLSASGKTNVIASTRGTMEIPGKPGVKLTMSIYTK